MLSSPALKNNDIVQAYNEKLKPESSRSLIRNDYDDDSVDKNTISSSELSNNLISDVKSKGPTLSIKKEYYSRRVSLNSVSTGRSRRLSANIV